MIECILAKEDSLKKTINVINESVFTQYTTAQVVCYYDPLKWLPSVTFQLEADLQHIPFWSHDLEHLQVKQTNKRICHLFRNR